MRKNVLFKTLFALALVLISGSAQAESWKKASLSDLTANDVFVIVATTSDGGNFAMSNDKAASAAPDAVAVTIENDKITSEVSAKIKWTLTLNENTGKYTFYPDGSTSWLYCTSNNNGVRVGGNSNSSFILKDNYLYNVEQTRYLGVYNKQDWRCYTTINNNIKDQTFAFYKYVNDGVSVEKPVITPATGDFEAGQTIQVTITVPQGTTVYYTTDETTPNQNSTAYTQPFAVTETTTVKAVAYDTNGNASPIVSATYTFKDIQKFTTIADLQAAATAEDQDVSVTFNSWVVTAVTASNAYVSDGERGLLIYNNGHGFKIGDKLSGTVACQLVLYRGQTELKGFVALPTATAGEAVAKEVGIADIKAENQCTLVKLTGVTYSNENLTDGTNSIPFYDTFKTGVTLTEGEKYDVTGVVVLFNTTLEIAPRTENDVVVKQDQTPYIFVSPAEVELDGTEHQGTLDVTIKNIDTQNVQVMVTFVDENGRPLAAEPDWITAKFENGKVAYQVESNTGDARTTRLIVSANNCQSNVVTITQARLQLAYATLPFEYDGDGTGELPDGLTAEGLGSPYPASPAMKFDTAGDYLILQINEQPGVLSFDIKGNSFSGSKFTVQTSADGQTYTDLKAYTELGAVQTVTFRELPADVRFIKWVYTAKDKGNVALGNIKLAKYVVLEKYFVKIASSETCELFVFDAADQTNPLQNGAEVYSGTELLVSAAPAQGYELEGVSVTDAEGQAVQLTKNADGTYSFTMPASNISVTATVKEIAPPSYINYTLAKSVERGKHYIIVGKSETGIYAMCEQKDNNRAALVIEANGEEGVKFMSDAGIHEFVINGFDGDYAIYDPSEESTGLLYAASGSSNYLRTTNRPDDNARWTISIDAETGVASIKAQGSNSRNIMRYNSGSGIFSCYGSGQKDIYLYVKESDDAQEESYYKTIAYEYATLCLPFAVEVPEGVESFIATAYSEDAVTLTKLDEGVIPAGTGVVVAADKKTVAQFVRTEKTARVAQNLLKGVTKKTAYADVTVQGKNAYALQLVEDKAKFCLVEGGSFAANTAYLELPAGQSQTIGLRFGDATMVEAVKAAEENSVIYDLTGRRVEKMTKGIYIVNGKKVMMK